MIKLEYSKEIPSVLKDILYQTDKLETKILNGIVITDDYFYSLLGHYKFDFMWTYSLDRNRQTAIIFWLANFDSSYLGIAVVTDADKKIKKVMLEPDLWNKFNGEFAKQFEGDRT